MTVKLLLSQNHFYFVIGHCKIEINLFYHKQSAFIANFVQNEEWNA